MLDPLLLDETSSEEEAAWLAAVEAVQDEAQAFVRRVTALARGYVLAEQAGRGDLAVADVMGGLALDRRSAENALGEALLFVSHPDTLQALDERRVGLRHARALMDVLEQLDPETADQVESTVLQALAAKPGRPPSRVRDMARRTALRLDRDAAVRRRRSAARKRHVRLRDAGDGMVEMTLLMRAEHGLQVLHRAEQQTRHDDGTGRTRDQRRLDWVVDTLLDEQPVSDKADGPDGDRAAGDEGRPPAGSDDLDGDGGLVLDGRRRRPVQVLVHVPVTTALGLTDEPCELEEVGPIDAEHGRLLLSTAELRKVCVDARTGQVLHVDDAVIRPVPDPQRVRRLGGTSRARAQATAEAVRAALIDLVTTPSVLPEEPEPQYRPSAGLARTLRARHPRCDFLTCSTPSRCSDLEHHRPYSRGGTTDAQNMTPRSRWCHQAKQRGWTGLPLPDGTTVWQSPSGRSYPAQPQHEPPPPLPPGAVLPPAQPPPTRDDDGPPDDSWPGHDAWPMPVGPPPVCPGTDQEEATEQSSTTVARPARAELPDDPPF